MPRRGLHSRRVGRYLPPFGDEFISIEALSGLVLLAATFAALVWANVAPDSYTDVWHRVLTVGPPDAELSLDLQHWVNDGLMAVFFFVVGLEIKRELVRGELRDPRTASLPVIAAIGGMVVPALLYTALNAGGDGARGWAIPMATDIAFAVGVLALLGDRVPRSFKLFLLTLAIVDDIGAIIVIAVFYSEGVALAWLAGAVGAVLLIVLLQRLGVPRPIAYVLPAVALWYCAYRSGVHPTIAGVALGLLTPARPVGGREVIERLEHRLHPWSSFVVVPIFALANAGVVLDRATLRDAAGSPIAWGIVLGLVVGKPLGIALATGLGTRLRLGRLPDGMRAPHVLGIGAVAGIGFTVSLFIDGLTFVGEALDLAKIAILVASVTSGVLGSLWLLLATRTRPPHPGSRAGGPEASSTMRPTGGGP